MFSHRIQVKQNGYEMMKSTKNRDSGSSVRIGISALRLHRQIRGIYAIAADTNKLGESFINIKGGGNKYE